MTVPRCVIHFLNIYLHNVAFLAYCSAKRFVVMVCSVLEFIVAKRKLSRRRVNHLKGLLSWENVENIGKSGKRYMELFKHININVPGNKYSKLTSLVI